MNHTIVLGSTVEAIILVAVCHGQDSEFYLVATGHWFGILALKYQL